MKTMTVQQRVKNMNLQKSVALLHRDMAVIAPAQHLFCFPIAVDRTEGDFVIDLDGNRYIDFLSSASSLNLGGSQPDLHGAMLAQMEKCMQYCTCYTLNQPMVEYAERLASVYPGGIPVKACFTHSGSDANDLALRFTRAYTGRANVVSFSHSYHGSTYATSGISASCAGDNDCALSAMQGARYFRYFYEGEPELPNYVEELERAFATDLPPETVAAVFLEPIQGDGGMRPAAKAFIRQLYELCRRHGILFLSDEVQQGFFRSGRWFSIEHYGVVPDGIVLGKSVGGGLPLGVFLARPEVMEHFPASICASTLAGAHLVCAAGIAQFDYLRQEGFQQRLAENSRLMAELTAKLAGRRNGGLRLQPYGVGMSYGIHVLDGRTGDPDPFTAYKIAFRCYETGLLMIPVSGNVLRLQPPLTIQKEHLTEGFQKLEYAMEEIASGYVSEDMLRFYSQSHWE